MTVPDGRVLRVAFTIESQPSTPGIYSATLPLGEYGYTPLTIGVAVNAATGAGQRINAASGNVTVRRADAAHGLFDGTLDAVFVDGTRVSGMWFCRVGE